MTNLKVIVIGGGATGLVAAILASTKHEVTILEKNSSVGKKILVTGNGKCNYFNTDFTSTHFQTHCPSFLEEIINEKNIAITLSFLEKLGIVPMIKNGYYYPFSNQAVSIQNILKTEAMKRGITICLDTEVEDVVYDESFSVVTKQGIYHADKVIFATGSLAYYANSSNTPYEILKKFGHHLYPILPGLVPLLSDFPYQKEWAGIRVSAKLSFVLDHEIIKEERGEVQLTNYGISGIPTMQLSNVVIPLFQEGKLCKIYINFLDGLGISTKEEALQFLEKRNQNLKERTVSELFDSILNYKLVHVLLKNLGLSLDSEWNQLEEKQKNSLIDSLVSFSLDITGYQGYKEAQICLGGIPLEEVTTEFESIYQKGLYIIGEILDVAGDCGGYNLGFAWLSGVLAGGAL